MTTRTNSELALYRACPRRWQYRYVDRRTGAVRSQALSRGSRIHSWLANWWTGQTPFSDLEGAELAMVTGYAALYQAPHLHDIRVNVPWMVHVADGLDIAGECDAVGLDNDGKTIVVEHKTTTSEISPGSQYWRRVLLTDTQVSLYSLAFPGSTVLYDVLRVPSFRSGDLYSKSLDAMSKEPDKYFARHTVVRLEEEAKQTVIDIIDWDAAMAFTQNRRNPDGCFTYGRECEFFGACWEGRDIKSYPEWAGSENAEVVKERWGDG